MRQVYGGFLTVGLWYVKTMCCENFQLIRLCVLVAVLQNSYTFFVFCNLSVLYVCVYSLHKEG